MLKRYLPVQWCDEDRGHCDQLDRENPDEYDGPAGSEADAEDGELGRQPEVGEGADLPEGEARDPRVREPVLPAVENAVRAAEPAAVPARGRAAPDALHVEVDAQDGRERDESERGGERPVRVP